MIDDGPAPHGRGRRAASGALALALTVAWATACSDGASRTPGPAGRTSAPVGTLSPAAQLAAHAARAQDRHYSAEYRFRPATGATAGTAAATGRVARTAGGVRLDLTHPATAGTLAHTTVVVRAGGARYVCVLTAAASGCVTGKAAGGPPGAIPAARLQHAFDDWLATLTSRTAALSVAPAGTPGGVQGSCWSVEPVAASLDPAVDPGLYCFDETGLLTAVRLAAGTLTLVSAGAPPAAVELPAVVAPALPPTAAPPPSPSGTPSPSDR